MTAGQASVSVVIPCFNQAHFLSEAIESALAQSHPVEVVVVDDGSEDNCVAVARRYPEVHCLSQANGGVAAARNRGLLATSSSFVVFLDSDDRLLPHAVEVGLKALEKRPSVAFAAGMCRDIGQDGRQLGRGLQPLVTQDHYLRLLEDCFIWSGSSLVYRREAIEAVGGFNEGLRAADDYELYLKLAHGYPVYCHETVVTEYRRHGHNTTRDAAIVLTSQLVVLRGQRPFLCERRERAACRAGMRKTRNEHGRALAAQIASAWRARRHRRAVHDLLILLHHDPGGLFGLALPAA